MGQRERLRDLIIQFCNENGNRTFTLQARYCWGVLQQAKDIAFIQVMLMRTREWPILPEWEAQ